MENNKLYVKNLPFKAKENDIIEFFQGYKIIEVVIPMRKIKSISKGYAFVTFESIDHARSAMMQYNGKEMDGRILTIQFSKPDKHNSTQDANTIERGVSITTDLNNDTTEETDIPTLKPIQVKPIVPISANEDYSETNIFVTNLPFRLTKQELLDFFSKYSPNDAIMIYKTFPNGRRGFGGVALILLPNHENQMLAIEEMNGKEFKERKIKVEKAKEQRKKNEKETSKTAIKVSNVNEIVNEEQIVLEFQHYGVINIKMIDNRQHLKTFVVQLNSEQNQSLAIQEMNNKSLYGKNIRVEEAYKSDEMQPLEPEIHQAKLKIKKYLKCKLTKYEYNGKVYQIPLENGMKPGKEFIYQNEGTPVYGIPRDLKLVLDYDNENGMYSINGYEVIQIIYFDKQYEGQTTRFNLTIITGQEFDVTFQIINGYASYIPEYGLKDEQGQRARYIIVIQLV